MPLHSLVIAGLVWDVMTRVTHMVLQWLMYVVSMMSWIMAGPVHTSLVIINLSVLVVISPSLVYRWYAGPEVPPPEKLIERHVTTEQWLFEEEYGCAFWTTIWLIGFLNLCSRGWLASPAGPCNCPFCTPQPLIHFVAASFMSIRAFVESHPRPFRLKGDILVLTPLFCTTVFWLWFCSSLFVAYFRHIDSARAAWVQTRRHNQRPRFTRQQVLASGYGEVDTVDVVWTEDMSFKPL